MNECNVVGNLPGNKNDIVWIDWVKFICIFFVYWLHVGQLGNCNSGVVIPYGLFFVNAFFFVSGYFVFQKQLSAPLISKSIKEYWSLNTKRDGFLANILFKIAIPSIFFSMIDFIPKSLVMGKGIDFKDFIFETMLRGTNWFTCALCISELIVFLFLLSRNNKIWVYLVLSIPVFVAGKVLFDTKVTLCGDLYFPWFYKSGMMACLLLVFGGIFGKYEPKIDLYMNKHTGGGVSFNSHSVCSIMVS